MLKERSRQSSVPLLIGGVGLIRWAIDTGLGASNGMISFAGLKRVDEAHLTWWYERLRTIRFRNTEAISKIMHLTSGIPVVISILDRLLPTGYDIDIDETAFEEVINNFSQ